MCSKHILTQKHQIFIVISILYFHLIILLEIFLELCCNAKKLTLKEEVFVYYLRILSLKERGKK